MPGPCNTPAALAVHPWHAAYWGVAAQLIYSTVIINVAALLSADVAAVYEGTDPQSLQLRWMIFALVEFALLVQIMRWCEQVGAGPFAGEVRVGDNWIAAAVVAGPFVLQGALSLSMALFGGELYSSSADAEATSSAALGPMMVLVVVVLAPLFEEISLRGVALGALLARGWSAPIAAALTSLVFAMLHQQYTLAGLVAIFAFGLFLAWLRIASRSITPPILAHMSANGVSLMGLV